MNLQPISLVIPGGYWDTQIYSGDLTLFRDDGVLVRVRWRDAIDGIARANPNMQTGLRVAFRDGDMFYNESVRKILLDPQVVAPIRDQLVAAAGNQFVLEATQLSQLSHVGPNPLAFVPADSETYYHTLFVAGEEGLYSVHRTGAGYTSKRHHDAPTTQVKASFDTTAIATAAGDDGLFEFQIQVSTPERLPGKEKRVSSKFCTSCDWAFQSIVAWSDESAFLANYTTVEDRKTARTVRLKSEDFDLGEVFRTNSSESSSGSSAIWGSREKLYRLSANHVDVLEYDYKRAAKPRKQGEEGNSTAAPPEEKFFDSIGRVEASQGSDEIVAVGTAPFGTVVEYDDRLVVMRSDGTQHEYIGEIVHWRVFPRSDHYSNQLHICYEDRLEVVSFVHDYFVNQRNKLIGFNRTVRDDVLI